MAHPLSPKFTKHEARDKMGNSPEWVNYALRIQHHPEIKSALIISQSGKCPVCEMPVNHTDTVHHISYLAKCKTGDTIKINSPTPYRPNRVSLAPPCADCSQKPRCLKLLTLVHDRCHMVIHKD